MRQPPYERGSCTVGRISRATDCEDGRLKGAIGRHRRRMWLNLAASRLTGKLRNNAVGGRDLAADRMTPEDRSEAQRLTREWDAAHPR